MSGSPSGWFYVLEVIVNISMIVEVTIRFFALGRVSETSLDGLISHAQSTFTAVLEIIMEYWGCTVGWIVCCDFVCVGFRGMLLDTK